MPILAILVSINCSGNDFHQKRPPNILLILADDLGNNDLASWGDGTAPTPTLDELSRHSVRFRQHFVDSTCSPSRAALLSGQHPVSIGFQADGLGLSSDLQTLPKSLKKLGYTTAHIGKWHLGEALEYPEIQPGNQGFDYWLGMLNHFVLRGPGPDGRLLEQQPTHLDPWLQENGTPPRQYNGYLDDILTEKAIELLSANKQPWFINLWLLAPHTPYQPSPRFANQFPDTEEGRFLSILKHLDFNVQQLLDALDQKGLAENTIVIFASDNGGPNIARNNNFPLNGKKNTYLDGGVRTPLLLRWPHHYEDSDIIAPTHITDIYPTLIALAGGKPPKKLMGRDLCPLMDHKSIAEPADYFWMADIAPGHMTFGGHSLANSTYYYRDFAGTFRAGISHPAITSHSPDSSETAAAITETEAYALISTAEKKVRIPPFQWQPNTHSGAGKLSGYDFQRAPAFGGFTLGLSLKKSKAATKKLQTLLEQENVWRIDWLSDQRIRVRVGQEEQFTSPISATDPKCNSLIVTTDIKPVTGFPFPDPPASILRVYWNDQIVLDSQRTLSRPQNAKPLKNPTWIGNSADGEHPFLGTIVGKPIVINKLLLPKQEGYNLNSLQQTLCHGQ